MVGEVVQLRLVMLDLADVGEYYDIVSEAVLLVSDTAEGLPRREHLSVLASVPQFALPPAGTPTARA